MQMNGHQLPQRQHPAYIEIRDTSCDSLSSSTSSVSIEPLRESSPNLQAYRDYINELSRKLQEENYVDTEELDVKDIMPQKSQLHQNVRRRSNCGSDSYIGKAKDRIMEEYSHQSKGEKSYTEYEESTFADEEAYLPMNPPSSRHTPSNNNFFIPSHVKLNPRANLYLVILLSCIISISSLIVGDGKSAPRSSSERAALFFSSTSLLIAIAIGFGFRYAPLRIYITRPYSFYERFLGQIIDSREKAIAIVLLISTSIACGVVMQPQANLAVASNYRVLNSPLFYSTWLSVYACVVIIADLFTQNESRWIVARDCDGDGGVLPSSYHSSYQSTALKTWFVSLFTNFVVSGILFSVSSSGLYEIYRTKLMVTGFLSLCGGLIAALMLALHNMVKTAQEHAYSYGTCNTSERSNPQKHLNAVGLGLGLVVLVLNSTIIALICSPPTGPGSIVLPCWVAFIVSVLLCKLYVESSLVTQPQLEKCSKDMCSESDRSKGTHTTALESNYIDSCDENDSDSSTHDTNEQRLHDDLMSQLATLSASFAGQQQPEEETPKRPNAPPQTKHHTERPKQEPEQEFPQDFVSVSTKKPTQASKRILEPPVQVGSEKFSGSIRTKTDPPPSPYQMRRGDSGKAPPSPRYAPPPPPPPPPVKSSRDELRSKGESSNEFIAPAYRKPPPAESSLDDRSSKGKSSNESIAQAYSKPPPVESSRDERSNKGRSSDESIAPVNRNKRKSRRKSKRASSKNDGSIRLSGISPAGVDAVVADALRYARVAKKTSDGDLSETEESLFEEVFRKHRQFCRRRSSGVMSDSDQSNEQKRAYKTKLAGLLQKEVGHGTQTPPKHPSRISFSDNSKEYSSLSDRSKKYYQSAVRVQRPTTRAQRTKSKRQSLSTKSTSSYSDPFMYQP